MAGDIYGGRSKFTSIPVPIGRKIMGKVVEVKLSEKIADYLSISVEFPEYRAMSQDGKKEFVKKGYYGAPIDWSAKNKAGRLYMALMGRLPENEEQVNWTKLLMGKTVACVFEATFDEATGEPKGDRICWMGAPTASMPTPSAGSVPTIQQETRDDLRPDEEVPF